ncbi:MAG: ABC transporter ATP-binding protein [Chloroflexi bacterium]|nr:ABC transporter ATP-binding protein [Chloroflexota bacterium]
MGWVMGGLDRDSYDRQYKDSDLIRRILQYFRPRARDMGVAAGAIFVNSVFTSAVPIIISRSIDLLATDATTLTLVLLSVGVMLLQSLAWLLNYTRQIHSARAIGDVVLQLRQDVLRAVVRHDLSFYDEQPSGKIVSRVTNDTQDFALTADLVMNLASELLSVAIMTIVAMSINVRLTLIILAMSPLFFAIALSFRKVARKVTLNARRVLAKVNANIQESVSGIAVAKTFRQEQKMYDEFSDLNRQAYRVNVVRGLPLQSVFPAIRMSFGIATAVVLYFGGRDALAGLNAPGGVLPAGAITVGEWYLFMQVMMFLLFPMSSIASFWSQFQDGLSAAERAFALIDAEPRVVQTDSRPVPRLQGRVEFRHVHLTYTGKEVVLPDFSLTVEAGESVALVGHTGAGKTSIGRLLGRFYEFQGGQILVDGEDIRTFDLQQYHRQVGFVPQSPFLFSGTVLDNIRYGKPEASREDVERAALLIGGGEWIQDLPEGLDTDVGERGSRLSMGQRQLVALARVVLQDPAIFILDEATASVDPFTETQIQQGLELVMHNRTSLLIAHRLFTVRNANRIIVLKDGEIIEEGNHEALLEQGGHYAELYDTYFRHQSLEYIEQARELGKADEESPDDSITLTGSEAVAR